MDGARGLTVASLDLGLVQHIMQLLEVPEHAGRAACVSRQFRQAVEPLAPELRFHVERGSAEDLLKLLLRGGVNLEAK